VFVELIEALRCPRPHEEAQLVAAVSRTTERHIMDGVLGCPVCGAEYVIAEGVARFDEVDWPSPAAASAEEAMRLAAFLELTDTRGFALLFGRWGAHVDYVKRLSETPILLVNPPETIEGEAAGIVLVRDALPLAPLSARAAALDERVSADLTRSAVQAVRTGGRMIGPVSVVLPKGLTELARDAHVWVAEKTAAAETTPRLIPIQRAKR
jgi:uncharacterized protein YbaR (Trm112 family)